MSRRKKRDILEPNLTPLIDIVFLLLIFFIVSSVFKKKTKEFNIQLPKTQAGKEVKEEKKENIIILIKEDSYIYGELELDDIDSLSKEIKKIPKNSTVELKVDKKVLYEDFIEVFDIIKVNNIKKVKLITEQKDIDE